jgi:predicted secreted hydrolase
MGHFAMLDEAPGKYLHESLIEPQGKNANASTQKYAVSMDKWSAGGDANSQHIRAAAPKMSLELTFKPLKPAVLHGGHGVVDKGNGLANYYMSYTRLAASGTISFEGKKKEVEGIAWFDHEYGYMDGVTRRGWDWYSIQLDDNTEYMIYAISRPDHTKEASSRACKIDQAGAELCIPFSDVRVDPLGFWQSPATKAQYPSGWHMVIGQFGLDVDILPTAADQEFRFMNRAYWEGSCKVIGKPANGLSYTELVGYARSEFMNRVAGGD